MFRLLKRGKKCVRERERAHDLIVFWASQGFWGPFFGGWPLLTGSKV